MIQNLPPRYLRPLLQMVTVATCLGIWLSAAHLYALNRESSQTLGEMVVTTASRYLAVPYGGLREGKRFDCSGLVQHVYSRHGINLPRRALEQADIGEKVALADAQAGDLLFFTNTLGAKSVDHVAIALGDGRMVHASLTRHRVVIDPINDYFQRRLLVVRRVRAVEGPAAGSVVPRIAAAF